MEPDGRVDEGGEAGEPTTKVTKGGHGMVADEVSFDLFDEVLVEASTARQHAYDEVLYKLEGMQRQLQEYKDQASQLESSSSTLQFENSQLKLNISALYKTAKAEIRRKDAAIRMLNSRLASLTYFGREHQKVTTRYSSLPSTCQRSPRLSCQHLVNEQDAQDYHSIQGFSAESYVSLPGNNSLTTSQMSLPPSHLSSKPKELCTINKNESQEKDIEDSQRVPIASLTPRQVTISTSDDFGKVSLQTPNNKCISKRQEELCFNTLEYQSGSSLKSLAVAQPASASTTTEEHRDSLDLEQKMLMRVNGMHETCPSDGTKDLPNRLQALSLNHDGGTLASQCQTASGVGRMKENWNKVSKTKDADTFLDFNTRNISRINTGEKRKRYFKDGGNIGGMMIKSKQKQNRDVEIICDGGRERKEENRRDVQKCRETSCVSKWKSATKRCRDSERESESTGGDVCKRTKGSSTLNSRDKPRWSSTLNTTNKAVESSTLSRDKRKEHSTFSKVDKTKESSILIIKEKAKENTILSSSVEAKESSTSSSRDKAREGSTSSSRDKVMESSTSSSRDKVRESSTSSSRDNARDNSTSSSRDKGRESSTSSSRDKARESSTASSRDKARENSTSSSRDKARERSTSSSRDKARESSTSIRRDKARESSTSSSRDKARESSTSSSRDKARESSISSSRDKVRESSTSSSRDKARESSTSSSRDKVRESSTSSSGDIARESSNLSSNDKANYSTTLCSQAKAREIASLYFKNKMEETAALDARCMTKKGLTSDSGGTVEQGPTSGAGETAEEGPTSVAGEMAEEGPTSGTGETAEEGPTSCAGETAEEGPTSCAGEMAEEGPTSCVGESAEEGPTSGAGETAEEGPTSGAGETAEEGPTSGTGETAEEGPKSCAEEMAEEGPTSCAEETAEECPTSCAEETAEEGPTSCAGETAEEGPTSCTGETAEEGPTSGAGETAEEGPTSGARETAEEGPTSGAGETAEEGLTSGARETAEEGPTSGAGETAEEGPTSGAGETAEEGPTSGVGETAEDGQTSGTRETAEEGPMSGAGETAEEFSMLGAGETAEVGLTSGTRETAEEGPILGAGETAEEGPTSGARETAEEGPTSGARETAEEGPTSGAGEMAEGSTNENQQIQADEGKFMPHVSIVGMNSDTCVLESQNRNNNEGEDDEQNDSLAGSAGQFVTCLIEMQATTINSSNSCTQGSLLANPPKDELYTIKAKLEQDEGCIIVSNDKQTTMDVEDGGKGDNCNWKIGITSIGMEDGIASGKGHSAMAEKAFMGSEKVIAESPIVGQCNIVQLLDENKVVEINLTNPKMDFMTSLSLTVSPLKQKEKHLSTILASSAKPQGLVPSGGGHKCGGQELRKMTTGNCGSEMTAGLEHEKRNLFEKSDFYDNGKKVDKNHLNNTPSCQLPSVSGNVQNNSNMHCQNDILERNETSDIEEGELVSDSEEEFSLFVQSKCIVNTLSSQNKNRNGTSSKQHLWVVNHQDKMKENQSFDHYRTGSEASHYTKKKEHLRSSQNSKHLQENASCWSSPVEAPCRSMSRRSAPRRSVPFEEPWRSVPFEAPRRPAPVEATRQHAPLAAPRRVALRSVRDEGPQRLTSLGLEPFTCLDVIDNHGDGSLAKISEINNDQVQTKDHASKKQYDVNDDYNQQQAGGFSTTVMSALQAARDVVQRYYSKLRKQFECERFWGILRLASREFPTNLEILDWRSHEALRCQILALIQQTVGNLKKSKCVEQVLQDKPCDMKVLLFKILQKELDSMFNIVQNLLLSVCPSGHAAKQIQEQRTRQLRVSFVNDESAEGPLPQQSFCIDNGACDNSKKKLSVLPAESVRNNLANEPNDVLRICYDKGFGDMNTYRIPKLSKKELPEMSCQNACRPLAKKHNKPPMEKSKRHSEVASSKLNVSTDEQQWKQKELLPKGPEMQFKPMIGSSEQHGNNLVPTSVMMVDYTVDMDSCDSLLAQRLWDTGDIEIDGCPATPGKSMFGPTSSEIKNTPASVESVSFSIFPEQVMGEAFKALVRATESQQQAMKPVLAHPFGNARCVGSVSKIRGCAESFLRSEQGRLPIISTILQADLELSHSLLSPLKDSLLFEPSHDRKCNNTSGAGLTKVLPEACFNENAQFEPDMITEDMSPIKDVMRVKEAEIPEGTDKRTDVNRQNGLTTNNPVQSQETEMMRKCTKEPFGTLDLQQVIGSCMDKSKKVTSDNQQAFVFRRSKECLMDHCGSEDFLTVETKTENDSVSAENVIVTSECVSNLSLTRQKGATLKTMEGGTGDDRLSDCIMLNNHINSLQTKSPSPHSALPSPSTTIEESNFTPCPATVEATVVQTRSPNMSTMVHRSKRSASVADHECSGVQNCSLCTKMTANRCKIPKGIPQFLSHQDRNQHKTLGSYDGEENATPSKVLPANNVVIENGERLMKWTREEDRLVLFECRKLGTSLRAFATMASRLQGKNAVQVLTRYQELLRLFHLVEGEPGPASQYNSTTSEDGFSV